MITKTTKLKQKFIIAILILALVFASFSGLLGMIHSNINTVLATDDLTVVELTNSSFNSSTVSGNIITPSGWSVLNDNNAVTKGVISLDNTIFQKQMEDSYKLSFKPYSYNGMKDNQILMINAEEESVSLGYQSSSITLNKNSYYMITFRAYTQNEELASIGSANLSGNDTLEKASISIVTSGNWLEYTFLIETDKLVSTTTNIELWLGYKNGVQSKGSIFFDDVNVYELSQTSYKTFARIKSGDKNTSFCNLNTYVLASQVENNNFENDNLTGWTSIGDYASVQNYAGPINFNVSDESVYKLDAMPKNNRIYGSNQALLINNKQGAKVGYKSSVIEIKQHGTYRISFYAKSNITSGEAVVKVVENDPYNETLSLFKTKEFKISIDTSGKENAKNNDWIEYNIYIQGRSFEDTSINLELWLGNEENATGYVMFDEIVIYQISSSNYETGISESNSLEADFSTVSSTELQIKNGKFNAVENQTATLTYPLGVKNWNNSKTLNNEVESGIINTLDTSMISRISGSYLSNGYSNNVLMIGNLGKNYQKFTTENSFSLNSNSYYKLSFKVQTQQLTEGTTAGVKLYTDNFTIKELMYIESNNEWTTYTLYIQTGLNSYTCYLELSLGAKVAGSGFAFFDDVILTESDKEAYNQTLSNNSYRVNLKTDTFESTSNKKVNGVYELYSYTATNVSGVSNANIITGAVDVLSADAFVGKLANITNPNMPQDITGNALLIHSTEDCNYYYTSKQTYSLTTGTYYKVSVWIFTDNLSQNEENKTEIGTTGNYYDYGATLTLTNINKTFSGINTNGEWKEYTFYINTTENADIQVKLGLGNTNALTSGTVYFTNLSIETIEQDNYYDSVKPLEQEDAPTNIMAVGSTEIEKEEETTDTESSGEFSWLIVSSLATAIALLAAIVAAGIRKYIKKHPRPVKVKTKEYNREVSLEKDFEHREAIRKQREKLEKLKEKLEDVKFEMVDTRAEFRKEQKAHKEQVEKQVAEIKKEQKAKQIKVAKVQKSTTLDKSYDAELRAEQKEQKAKLKAQKLEQKAEIKAFRQEQKRLFNEEKLARYKQRQKELQERFANIEMEIEVLYQEELRLIALYKEYKRQVRLKKKELREEKRKTKQKNSDEKQSNKEQKEPKDKKPKDDFNE